MTKCCVIATIHAFLRPCLARSEKGMRNVLSVKLSTLPVCRVESFTKITFYYANVIRLCPRCSIYTRLDTVLLKVNVTSRFHAGESRAGEKVLHVHVSVMYASLQSEKEAERDRVPERRKDKD